MGIHRMAHRLDAKEPQPRRAIQQEVIRAARLAFQRITQLRLLDPALPIPLAKTIVHQALGQAFQSLEIPLARHRRQPRRQLGRITHPHLCGLGPQPGTRPTRKVRVQAHAMPCGCFGQMSHPQFDTQGPIAQANTLLGAIGKRRVTSHFQHGFIRRLANHLPRLLPGRTVNRQRIGQAVGRECQPTLGVIETAVGNAVGPRHQRIAPQLARQTGEDRLLIVMAQQRLPGGAHRPIDEAAAHGRIHREVGQVVFKFNHHHSTTLGSHSDSAGM